MDTTYRYAGALRIRKTVPGLAYIVPALLLVALVLLLAYLVGQNIAESLRMLTFTGA